MKKELESNAVKASKQTETSCSKLKEEMASNLQKKDSKLSSIMKFVESLRTKKRTWTTPSLNYRNA